MKKNQLIINTFFTIICCILLQKSLFAEPANLGVLRSEVQAYHDSGAYQRELDQIISKAQHYIIRQAKNNAHSTHPKKLAIVLDIDETSLSNYKRMAARQFVANREQLFQEVLAADAPAIKPMLSLYSHALKQGVAIFFVTGRREAGREATIKNLKSAGYHDWSGLYLRPINYKLTSIIPLKTQARAEIRKQGYTIIADIGDQYSDLKGANAEKSFKLPNPYYYIP